MAVMSDFPTNWQWNQTTLYWELFFRQGQHNQEIVSRLDMHRPSVGNVIIAEAQSKLPPIPTSLFWLEGGTPCMFYGGRPVTLQSSAGSDTYIRPPNKMPPPGYPKIKAPPPGVCSGRPGQEILLVPTKGRPKNIFTLWKDTRKVVHSKISAEVSVPKPVPTEFVIHTRSSVASKAAPPPHSKICSLVIAISYILLV